MEKLRQNLKIFNYRPLVLVFVCIILGILFNNFISKYTALITVLMLFGVLMLVFYSVLHKKVKYIIIAIICFGLGFGCYELFINSHIHKVADLSGAQIEATVTSITTKDDYLAMIVDDVKIDGEAVKYSVRVLYYNVYEVGYEKLEKGDVVSLLVYSQHEISYFDDKGLPNTYYTSNNIGAQITTSDVEVIAHKDSLRNKLLNKARRNLRFGLNNQNGEMIYSAMFGDKTNLDEDLYDAYKASGVAHLLAVSGLHVGLVVAIIYWILKKLRVKNWWRVGIVFILLFCYAYLCNFSHSVIRASVMALVLLISALFYSEYDFLSSISLAGVLILLAEPTALFDVGALLSFGCVIGIAMLYPVIKRWIGRIPVKDVIIDSLSISASTIISTLITMGYYFNGVQLISIVSNILIIPIFSVLFTIAFTTTIMSLVIPIAGYLLLFVNPLLEYLNLFIMLIARIPNILILPQLNYLHVIASFILVCILGNFNLKRGLTKVSMCCGGIVLMSLSILI